MIQGKISGKVLRGKINRCDTLVVDAYDIAVKHGFTGTEEEWLESLSAKSSLAIKVSQGVVTNNVTFADVWKAVNDMRDVVMYIFPTATQVSVVHLVIADISDASDPDNPIGEFCFYDSYMGNTIRFTSDNAIVFD